MPSGKNRVFITVVLLWQMLPILLYASEDSLTSVYNTPLNQLKKQYQEKNYETVVEAGKIFLQQDNNAPDTRLYMGLAYYQLQQYDNAINVLKPVVSAYPTYLEARIALIRASMAKKNTGNVYALILDGLVHHPKNSILLSQKDSLNILNTKSAQVLKALKTLLMNKEKNEPTLQLSETFEKQPVENRLSLTKNKVFYEEGYVQSLYKQKKYKQVIEKGEAYLQAYPKEVDVRYYVGLSYSREKKYPQSQKQLQKALNQYPDYMSVRYALITTLFAMKKYASVLTVATDGLRIEPNNSELLMAKVKVKVLEKNYAEALQQVNNIIALDNTYLPARALKKNLILLAGKKKKTVSDPNQESKVGRAKFPRDVFSTATSVMDVTLPQQYWNYSSMSLYREDKQITYGAVMNYASRLGKEALQGGIAIIPKINKHTWISTQYSYANNPSLFADHTVYGEIFQNIFNGFTVSAGNEYRKISKTYFNTYTASLKTYVGSYSLTFRPFIYRTKAGPNSILYRTSLHYDFDDPDQYIEVSYYTGYSPDLFNLATVEFFKVHEQIIMVKSQFKLSKALLFQLGGGHENQKFLKNRQREITYLNLGFKYRIGDV